MDKETFDRIIRISETLKSLEAINMKIQNATLSFIGSRGYEVMMTSVQKNAIKDICSRHEAEIRQEIEDRYNDFKKQIEEL